MKDVVFTTTQKEHLKTTNKNKYSYHNENKAKVQKIPVKMIVKISYNYHNEDKVKIKKTKMKTKISNNKTR